MVSYKIRPMREEDIPQALEIEREAFPTQWPPTPFKRELQNRLAHYLVVWEEGASPPVPPANPRKSLSWVTRLGELLRPERGERGGNAEAASQYVVGLLGFWLLYDEAHITSIAIRETHRRRGLGELLLIACIEKALSLKARVVTLEVRVSNFSAQALYEKYGFKKTGIRRRYYTDNNEDGHIMSTPPLDSAPFQGHYQQLKESLAQRLNTSHPPPGWPLL